MTYRHKKSGVTFTTSCACEGENWEEVKASAPKAKDEKKQEAAADAQSVDSDGEGREEAKASAPASKAKRGKKQETAADAQSDDSGGEDS